MTRETAAATHILLIRHGESVWNAEGRVQGQSDPPLSPLGASQAQAIAQRLSGTVLAGLYCSPAVRAYDSALAIGRPHGLAPQREMGLLEVNLGSWQGERVCDLIQDTLTGYRDWERDPVSTRPPDGETLTEVYARVAPVFDLIVAKRPTGTVVVVTHSIVGRVAICRLLDSSLDLVARLRLKKASITKLRIDHGMGVLERLGDTRHLSAL